MGVGRKTPPRARPALVTRKAGEGDVAQAIADTQAAVRRLEGRAQEEAEAFTVDPLPVAIAAVQVDADGAFAANSVSAPIQDLYVVNLHATTIDTLTTFVQANAHVGGVVTGSPTYFSTGKGAGSSGGACSFFGNTPQLPRGVTIRSASVRLFRGVGPGTAQFQLWRVANAPVLLGSVSSTATPGGALDLTISGLSEDVGAAESYTAFVSLPVSQDVYETITIEFD